MLDVLAERGLSTGQEVGQTVPELQVRVYYGTGKPYTGGFSLGSRLVPAMCALELLIRAWSQCSGCSRLPPWHSSSPTIPSWTARGTCVKSRT